MTMETEASDPTTRVERYVIDYAKGGPHFSDVGEGSETQAVVRWDKSQDPRLLIHMHPLQDSPDFMSWGDKITADAMRVPNAAWSTTRNALMIYVPPSSQGGIGIVYMPR